MCVFVFATVAYSVQLLTCICLFQRAQTAECGVIEKILLINFMCHKRLEVNFNTNVNFVHGRNGSESQNSIYKCDPANS